jgi:cytochrome c oxidase subunit 4
MSVHVTPIRVYMMVFAILMVGTALTVWAAYLNMGPFNDIVAMAIAVTKATFVVLYFMHVKHSTRLTKVTVVAGFLWLAILVALTLSDYFTRGFLSG